MKLDLQTPLLDLYKYEIANLSQAMARKLAMATANFAYKTDLTEATVEDLLNYFPTRYEDRSNLIQIDELYDGLEASFRTLRACFRRFSRRQKSRSESSAAVYFLKLRRATRKERANRSSSGGLSPENKVITLSIITKTALKRGTRFVAYGKWEWDARKNTFALRLNKPDELEILPNFEDPESFGLLKNLSTAEDAENAENYSAETKNQKPKTKNQIEDEDLLEGRGQSRICDDSFWSVCANLSEIRRFSNEKTARNYFLIFCRISTKLR